MRAPITAYKSVVYFGETGYEELKKRLTTTQYSAIFIVTDENTHTFCLPYFKSRLGATQPLEVLTIPAGEPHKNITTCTNLWEKLALRGADRNALLITLGGGMVTDLGGFAAATFMRGIDFVNVPTSLLAMVDASIGGKTGVDLGVLKNMIGAFHFPKLVVIDPLFLKTLPENQLRSGWAEMLKHGLIYDEAYWNMLSETPVTASQDLAPLIRKSVDIKNQIVQQDPQEKNLRKILNYGHTLGHAIESHFLSTPHSLLHGEAVAIGLILASYISHKLLNFPLKKVRRIKNVIQSRFTTLSFEEKDCASILALLRYDKKTNAGSPYFVLLEDIGKPVINQLVPEKIISQAFRFYKA